MDKKNVYLRKGKRITKQQKKIQEAFNNTREVEIIPAKVTNSDIRKKE